MRSSRGDGTERDVEVVRWRHADAGRLYVDLRTGGRVVLRKSFAAAEEPRAAVFMEAVRLLLAPETVDLFVAGIRARRYVKAVDGREEARR